MMRVVALLFLALTSASLAIPSAFGHGASRGLHIHVTPDPALPGETLTVTIDSIEPVSHVTIGWVDAEPLTEKPEEPTRHVQVTIEMPKGIRKSILNLQAEARTTTGKTVRASALIRIRKE